MVQVEKTLHHQRAQNRVEALDNALRALAVDCTSQALPLPRVAAAQLHNEKLTVHLAAEAELPEPWQVLDQPTRWARALDQVDPVTEQPAPYPLLLTIGEGDDGSLWLLNMEAFGTLTLTGDRPTPKISPAISPPRSPATPGRPTPPCTASVSAPRPPG